MRSHFVVTKNPTTLLQLDSFFISQLSVSFVLPLRFSRCGKSQSGSNRLVVLRILSVICFAIWNWLKRWNGPVLYDTYMTALGFSKEETIGRYSNAEYTIWDLIPRNVLRDQEGDIFVVDAEIKRFQ